MYTAVLFKVDDTRDYCCRLLLRNKTLALQPTTQNAAATKRETNMASSDTDDDFLVGDCQFYS